jgi:hypothetical protein
MKFMEEFRKGRISIYLALFAMFVAAVPSHGYTMIAFIVFLMVCGVIWYIRSVSKGLRDQHYAWYAMLGVIVVEVQQQYPVNSFMFWHTIILMSVLIIMHFVAKAEVSYALRVMPVPVVGG